MTVAELETKLTFEEYLGWLEYFAEMSPKTEEEGQPGNLLRSPDSLIQGFGL